MEEPPSNVDALCRRSSQARSKKTRNAMITVVVIGYDDNYDVDEIT